MNTRLFSFIMFLVFVGLTACDNQATNHSSTETVFDKTPIKVTTQEVGSKTTGSTSVLSGTIQSKNNATVSARMMGYVTSLSAEVGDRVRAGQTILKIKNNELPAKKAQAQAGITEAEAALKNVKINYDRMQTLWQQESITRKEWDDISAQYDMMKAKVEGAKQMRNEIDEVIGLTVVKAPISGIVTARMINMGDLVNPGVPLMSIESDNGYEVVSYVSDYQISSVKKGMELDCHIKVLNKKVKARVTEISPSAVNTGGQFAIKADLRLSADEKKVVFPGMYANVHAALPRNENRTNCATVEKSALINRGQLTGVYTISSQNTALLRWVRVGKDFGDKIEIVSGLKSGEEYITGNLSDLVDGIPVSK